VDAFDKETKQLETELCERQKEQKEVLLAGHRAELDDIEAHWSSAKHFRQYNRASNKLTILRRQLAFLLVQSRFKDAAEVRKLVDTETKTEESESHGSMQRDYDSALAAVLARHQAEVETFDERASIQLQKFRQDRAVARRLYENRGRKLAARVEIAADPDKLWSHEQAKRAHAIAGNAGMPVVPSAKITRSAIADKDVAILSLPPLDSRRKKPKPPKAKAKPSETE
jgi:DNA-binding LytR/AlgR family response regulator